MRSALEQVTALAPKPRGTTPARLAVRQVTGPPEGCREIPDRDRAQPRNPLALNDLAYALGSIWKLQEALPFARRAVDAAPESDSCPRHTGLNEYLSGTTADLGAFDGCQPAPSGNREIRLHAAIVSAAGGSWAESKNTSRRRCASNLARRGADVLDPPTPARERRK